MREICSPFAGQPFGRVGSIKRYPAPTARHRRLYSRSLRSLSLRCVPSAPFGRSRLFRFAPGGSQLCGYPSFVGRSPGAGRRLTLCSHIARKPTEGSSGRTLHSAAPLAYDRCGYTRRQVFLSQMSLDGEQPPQSPAASSLRYANRPLLLAGSQRAERKEARQGAAIPAGYQPQTPIMGRKTPIVKGKPFGCCAPLTILPGHKKTTAKHRGNRPLDTY